MTLRIAAIAFAVAGTWVQSQPSPPSQPDPRVVSIRRGTVKVLSWTSGATQPEQGAAITIGELDGNTFFLTACHVVDDDARVEIQTFDKRAETVPVTVFENRCDESLDVAVLVAPSYRVSEDVELIVQSDPSQFQPGSRVLVMGHPPDRDWRLRATKVTSLGSSHVLVESNVVDDGDSGGPLLDTKGKLVGMIRGISTTGEGRAVRLDAAQAVLEAWHVPYKTRLRVDFCDQLNKMYDWSEKDFAALKGELIKKEYSQTPDDWELRDKSTDITGEGRSKLMTQLNTVQYVADFGKQKDEAEARKLWRDLALRVQACLPGGKERIFQKGDKCLWLAWRRKWSHTPMHYVVHFRPFHWQVSLIMYRSYTLTYTCDD